MKHYMRRMKPKRKSPPRVSLKKILWSLGTSFTAIFVLAKLNALLKLTNEDLTLLIGSFGASAVLLYGAPVAEYSQPRNVIGGHFLSALVGVSIAKTCSSDIVIASSLAVSLSISVMHLTRTLHPPGGATALIAIIGSEPIKKLGYFYTVLPVLTGALILTGIAVIVNNLSRTKQRHYPEYYI